MMRKVKFIVRDELGDKHRGKFHSDKELSEIAKEIEQHFGAKKDEGAKRN